MSTSFHFLTTLSPQARNIGPRINSSKQARFAQLSPHGRDEHPQRIVGSELFCSVNRGRFGEGVRNSFGGNGLATLTVRTASDEALGTYQRQPGVRIPPGAPTILQSINELAFRTRPSSSRTTLRWPDLERVRARVR
jgi:hypothetical protein